MLLAAWMAHLTHATARLDPGEVNQVLRDQMLLRGWLAKDQAALATRLMNVEDLLANRGGVRAGSELA